MKPPKEYQKRAIDKLVTRFKNCILNQETNANSVTLWAPTGSGKTFIMTKVLEKICEDDDLHSLNIVFVWASIGTGKLNIQSYNSVNNELEGSPACYQLDPTYIESHNIMDDRGIFFVNWESIVRQNTRNGQWINTIMRDGERNNLQALLNDTRRAGYKICLIVDESHIGQDPRTHISNFKSQIIRPDFTFEMSATPTGNFDERFDVKINIEDVQSEGMMKQGIKINSGIIANDDASPEGPNTLTMVLEKAENKRIEILNEYRRIGSNVNPLVLVQIPDSDTGVEMREFVETFLSNLNHPITTENGRLGCWFDNEKNFNSEDISRNDNEIEYLIFKKAIETGWDCPRAHILVKFREGNAPVPLIQTIGRIYRTAEAKRYDNDTLDYGYIFTNMKTLHNDDLENLGNGGKDVSVHVADDKDKTLLGLLSYKRPPESVQLNADFRINPIIESKICKKFNLNARAPYLDTVLDLQNLDVTENYLAEIDVGLQQIQNGLDIEGNLVAGHASDIEIRGRAREILFDNSNGLSSRESINTITSALCTSIENHMRERNRTNIYHLVYVLIVRNQVTFGDIIDSATREFKERYTKQITGHYEQFEIPDVKYYSSRTFRPIYSYLSLYNTMYVPNNTQPLEDRFCYYLDSHFRDRIEWIWHNGQENSDENFGIRLGNNESIFRPDFIIKFSNGKIGIFDTKPTGNFEIADTRQKAESLYTYLNDRTLTPQNIFGGIIVERNGRFYLNQQQNYQTIDDDEADYYLIDDIF